MLAVAKTNGYPSILANARSATAIPSKLIFRIDPQLPDYPAIPGIVHFAAIRARDVGLKPQVDSKHLNRDWIACVTLRFVYVDVG